MSEPWETPRVPLPFEAQPRTPASLWWFVGVMGVVGPFVGGYEVGGMAHRWPAFGWAVVLVSMSFLVTVMVAAARRLRQSGQGSVRLRRMLAAATVVMLVSQLSGFALGKHNGDPRIDNPGAAASSDR